MQTVADQPTTRLLKTKMFTEQLVVKRKKDGPPGSWEAPTMQTRPLDEAVNAWVDKTGNEIVTITAPSMFMQWMDVERTVRLVVASVMVTYVPALAFPTPMIQENLDESRTRRQVSGWEPAI